MTRFLTRAILGAALVTPFAMTPVVLQADDRRYEDRDHHDQHVWDAREDRVYRKWREDKHAVYREFHRLKAKEQREYWKWRHEHPDLG